MRCAVTAFLALGLVACTGDDPVTDTTTTGDSGTTEPVPTVSGVWNGPCDFPSTSKKDASLEFRMFVDEGSAGAVDTFGLLSVVNAKTMEVSQRLGFEGTGTFDSDTGALELLLDLGDIGLDFDGTMADDSITGDMILVSTEGKSKKGSFACTFSRE